MFDLERTQITAARLRDHIGRLNVGESLFVSSRAKLASGKWVHFPMMDFMCYDAKQDLRKIVFAISAIGAKPGVVLRSGKSFHFYGYTLLTQTQWLQFLGKCLLLMPISDARYVGHRMIDGVCTLRLSSASGQAEEPAVVEVLN